MSPDNLRACLDHLVAVAPACVAAGVLRLRVSGDEVTAEFSPPAPVAPSAEAGDPSGDSSDPFLDPMTYEIAKRKAGR